jgi:hypothetical protein
VIFRTAAGVNLCRVCSPGGALRPENIHSPRIDALPTTLALTWSEIMMQKSVIWSAIATMLFIASFAVASGAEARAHHYTHRNFGNAYRAHDLRRECMAFGKMYKDGESFTLSTGEYGSLVTYVCVDGTWSSYDGPSASRS